MKWKPSYTVVAAICVALLLWFGIRSLFGSDKTPEAPAGAASAGAGSPADQPLVQTALISAQTRNYAVVLRGRTEARRTVQVRSETAGLVTQTPVEQGSFVRKGQLLCHLAIDSRQASLDQAKANLKSRALSRQASAQLAKDGYRSPTQVLQDQAAYDSAAAAVRAAEVEMGKTHIVAPFDGVFDRREIEVGGYLSPGQSCGTVVELDPLLVVADVAEDKITALKIGSTTGVKLSTGETTTGRVRFISRTADTATRTYRVEIQVPNAGNRLRAGLSADISIAGPDGQAHLIPASSFVLDAKGDQGVRHVTADNKVQFARIEVLSDTPDGVWVKGLTGPVRLITVGQSFVGDGQTVRVAAAK